MAATRVVDDNGSIHVVVRDGSSIKISHGDVGDCELFVSMIADEYFDEKRVDSPIALDFHST